MKRKKSRTFKGNKILDETIRKNYTVDKMNCDDAIRLLQEHKIEIQKFGVESIGLFGSVSRNENNQNSDIDIFVKYIENKLNLDTYMDLKYYLQNLFKCEVDLVTVSSLRSFLKEEILSKVIYAA